MFQLFVPRILYFASESVITSQIMLLGIVCPFRWLRYYSALYRGRRVVKCSGAKSVLLFVVVCCPAARFNIQPHDRKIQYLKINKDKREVV